MSVLVVVSPASSVAIAVSVCWPGLEPYPDTVQLSIPEVGSLALQAIAAAGGSVAAV